MNKMMLENRVEILEHKIKKLEGNRLRIIDKDGYETFKVGYLIGSGGHPYTEEDVEIAGLKCGYLRWEAE